MQNSARTTLLQAIAGMLVVAGALATWRQVQVSREGHITDRFTKAVDQLGSDSIDVRIGGIYALERVAKNSPADRPQVQYVLGAFVRGHAPWADDTTEGYCHPTPEVDQKLPWLYARAPDIQAAMNVLGRRLQSRHALRLYLSRVDLRSVNLNRGKLPDAAIRHANLARAWQAECGQDSAEHANRHNSRSWWVIKGQKLRLVSRKYQLKTGFPVWSNVALSRQTTRSVCISNVQKCRSTAAQILDKYGQCGVE